ncbi:hypothetical protein HPB50_008539 [Hyalomma asiaticum]|uniref:Uncharacterized protein n=1 Tax=Hyalomma asiaticum TaxID=266040 RepID=A0ACB7SD79_HYAAI|nr:hypothetical protein HPB50_008539 [Hyalomma asiaticum]
MHLGMSGQNHLQFKCCVCCVFVIAAAAGTALLVTLFILHRLGAPKHAKAHEGRAAVENVTVSTNLGLIEGVALQVLDKRVVAFYGVPFAQPPVGPRRYRVPQRHAPWKATFNATEREDVRCAQVAGGEYFESQTNSSADEDCLVMDIFVPSSAYYRTSRAIVVVLHGGGFRTGSNRHPLYDGRWLASVGDVVVAVPNYRLGPLGFLRSGEGAPDGPGNQGLWDQLLAIQWMRANAASFGASSNRVTLLGVDSGAVSAGLHLLSPLSRQFFERAVLAGGSPFIMSRYSAFAELDELRQLAATVCDEPPSEPASAIEKEEQALKKPSMACLRAATAEHIVESLEEFDGVSARPFGPVYGANDSAEDDFFLPTASGDSYLLPDEEGVGGAFGGKALVIGYSANEGEYFLRQFIGQWDLESADSLPRPLVRLLLDRLVLHFFGQEQLAELRTLYFGDLLADNDSSSFSSAADAYLQAASFLGDVLVKCPARMMAELSSAGGASVYFYELDYNVNALAVDEGAGLKGRWSGAPHYTDALFMLGAFLEATVDGGMVDGGHVFSTSRRMMGKVGAFARTGVPDRTRDVPWPLYRRQGREMAAISLNRLRIETLPRDERCRALARSSRWSFYGNIVESSSAAVEVVAVQVRLGRRCLSVVSIYACPKIKVPMKSLIKDICSRCPPPRILCGDFNAHHSLWSDKMVDARGKEIVDAMDAENLCVANDKKPTFFRPPNSTSVIDLRFFGNIRSYGGHEDHPTTVNFYIFRLLTIYAPMKAAIKGNVEAHEDILPVLSGVLEAGVKDSECKKEKLHARLERKLEELCFALPDTSTMAALPSTSKDQHYSKATTEYSVIYYLAGYTVHKISKRNGCLSCLADIQSDAPNMPAAWLTFARSFKEMSLEHPTEDVPVLEMHRKHNIKGT